MPLACMGASLQMQCASGHVAAFLSCVYERILARLIPPFLQVTIGTCYSFFVFSFRWVCGFCDIRLAPWRPFAALLNWRVGPMVGAGNLQWG